MHTHTQLITTDTVQQLLCIFFFLFFLFENFDSRNEHDGGRHTWNPEDATQATTEHR